MRAEQASKVPEEAAGRHGSQQQRGGGSSSIIAEEIAGSMPSLLVRPREATLITHVFWCTAELAPAGQGVTRSTAREAVPMVAPSG